MNRFLALVAFCFLAAFLLILAYEVPSPDLVAVIVLVLALVATDMFLSSRKND